MKYLNKQIELKTLINTISLLIVLIAINSYSTYAQNELPYFHITGNKYDLYFKDHLIEKSGNHILLGEFDNDSLFINDSFRFENKGWPGLLGNEKDGFLIKFDTNGYLIYQKHIWCTGEKIEPGYNGGLGVVSVSKMTLDIDGNIIITGTFCDDTLHFGNDEIIGQKNSEETLFIIKLNDVGDIIWYNVIRFYPYGSGEINSLVTDEYGALNITGNFIGKMILDTFHLDKTDATDCSFIFIARYSSTGKVIWVKSIGEGGINTVADIICDADGNSTIIGNFEFNKLVLGKDTLTPTGRNLFILSFNRLGDFKWARQSFGYGSDLGRKIETDAIGNIYIMGFFVDSVQLGSNKFINTSGSYNQVLAKYSKDGSLIWAEMLPTDYGGDIFIDNQNNIVVCGKFISDTFSIGNFDLFNKGNSDIFIAKLDDKGNIMNVVSIGGIKSEIPLFLRKNSKNGSIYLSGWYTSPTLVIDNIYLKNNHTSSWGSAFVVPIKSIKLGISPPSLKNISNAIVICPNPNNGISTITSKNALSSIEVYNLTGKRLYSDYNLKRQNSVDIDLSDLQKGIYFARIQDGKKVMTEMIIIQ